MSEDIRNQHGMISWGELMTTDVEGAKTFYSRVLGYHVEEMSMAMGPYSILSQGSKSVAGIMGMMPGLPTGTPPHWGI